MNTKYRLPGRELCDEAKPSWIVTCNTEAVINSYSMKFIDLFNTVDMTVVPFSVDREKLSPQLSSGLKGLSVSRQWQTSGRMCTPRLLFVSQQVSICSL